MDHYTKNQLLDFADGKYPYSKLIQITTHLNNCEICLELIKGINPQIISSAKIIGDYRKTINTGDFHFSKEEIKNYVIKSFNIAKRLEMNNHFKDCRKCSERLKTINPDYLTSFVRDEIEGNKMVNEAIVVKKEESSKIEFNYLIPVSALLLLLSLSLTFTIYWLIPSVNEIEQAKFEINPVEKNVTSTSDTNTEQPVVVNNSNKNENQGLLKRELQPKLKSEKTKVKNELKVKSSNDLVVLETRGLNEDCENETIIINHPDKEQIIDKNPTLSWKPVLKASSYKIFLSDSKNILIEESTIPGNVTNYKVKNTLELNKKYEWQVVARQISGNEINGEIATFTVGTKPVKSQRVKLPKTQTRCINSK